MILVFLGAFTNIKLYFIALVMIMVKRRHEPIRSFLRETLRLPATSNKNAQAGRGRINLILIVRIVFARAS